MIVIIADDISGAAELAGVARAHGLRSEVHTRFDPGSSAEVIAVDTDTRSLSAADAAAKVRLVAAEVTAADPKWIFKKTDSVGRGNIAAEIHAIMEVVDVPQSVLIPANPGKLRTIRDGTFLVNGVPLHETGFADDPEYPARSAKVEDLLSDGSHPVVCLGTADNLTPGINVPDAWEGSHLSRWAEQIGRSVLPAGAAEFFAALLTRRIPRGSESIALSGNTEGRQLFVCGSCSGWANGRRRECEQHGVPIVAMPVRMFGHDHNAADVRQWADDIYAAFQISDRVMMAVGGEQIKGGDPTCFAERMIDALALTLEQVNPERLCLEGGATAAAVARRMGWHQLEVLDSIAFGIASLQVRGAKAPLIYIKPGSYPWPASLWGGDSPKWAHLNQSVQ
jgi:D-threonate/D-erythronate kinase